jgi:hypothetical protein
MRARPLLFSQPPVILPDSTVFEGPSGFIRAHSFQGIFDYGRTAEALEKKGEDGYRHRSPCVLSLFMFVFGFSLACSSISMASLKLPVTIDSLHSKKCFTIIFGLIAKILYRNQIEFLLLFLDFYLRAVVRFCFATYLFL